MIFQQNLWLQTRKMRFYVWYGIYFWSYKEKSQKLVKFCYNKEKQIKMESIIIKHVYVSGMNIKNGFN
jgi:hypothetical protein